jgi:uncharacterized membrane protein
MATPLRPLSTGELLDRTFFLYRGHFGLFIGIFALPHLVVLAYQCIGLTLRSPTPQLTRALFAIVWGLGALFLTSIVAAASQAATVVAVSQVHLERPTSIADSFSRVKGEIAGVIGLTVLVGLGVGLGFIVFIVPGILLALSWSVAVPAKVLESKGASEAMSRSSALTKGDRGRIFVIWFLFFVASIGVSFLLHWPIQIASGARSIFALQRVSTGLQVASLIATFVSECLVGPLATIAFSLVYYDERVRKEAFDLQLMMTTLDAVALPASPVQAGA